MEPAEKSVCGVLVLVAPPGGSSPEQWYQKIIVGVPFLLLNILNLQRGGIDRLVIYHPAASASGSNPLAKLAYDDRVQGEVEWVSDAETLEGIIQDRSCRMVVNGAALQNKADIAAALDGSLEAQRGEAMGLRETPRDAARQAIEDFEKADEFASGGVFNPGPPRDEVRNVMVVAGSSANRVRRDEDFRVQQEHLLTQGGMASDSFMDRWVSRHCSRLFTRWLIDKPVTPNQITWMHLVVGVVSAGFFYQGTYAMGVVGMVLLMISAWLDATDGEVARLRFQQSHFGMILDIIGDNVVHWAVFLGIGWGAAHATGNDIYIYFGVFSVVGAVISFWLLQASVFKKRGGGDYQSSGWQDELANRDFLYFLLVMALLNQLDIFIAITAVGSNMFAGYVYYKKHNAP